jgi:hypothetical protein
VESPCNDFKIFYILLLGRVKHDQVFVHIFN